VHDYQPLPAIFFVKKNACKYVWHFHQDYSNNARNSKFLSPYLKKYLAPFSRYIFSNASFVPKLLRHSSKVSIFTPCIDPLNAKNKHLSKARAWEILKPYHINKGNPMISQISRFNPWKDPIGVLEAFLIARRRIPKLQLVLMCHQVGRADPEQIHLLNEVRKKISGDPQVIIIINAANNDLVVNALQTVSDIVLQKSIREGFGQTVTEAMWKGALVIGGNAVGIRTQIQSGVNGYIISSINACASKIQTLLLRTSNHDKKSMKTKARRSVKKRFLLPTLIYNNLRTYVDALQ
jgi:trehalose synthase